LLFVEAMPIHLGIHCCYRYITVISSNSAGHTKSKGLEAATPRLSGGLLAVHRSDHPDAAGLRTDVLLEC
jgi:hypothetical protein